MVDLYAFSRPDLHGVWIQSSLDRKPLSLRKNIASLGFRASRRRVELATCEFQSTTTATRGAGTPSVERGECRPTGPFTTTGIFSSPTPHPPLATPTDHPSRWQLAAPTTPGPRGPPGHWRAGPHLLASSS
jgi:hypothetical protein